MLNRPRGRASGLIEPGYNRPARHSSFDLRPNTLTDFPDDKFLIARCKTKSGTILGGALLRPLVWWWCAANFSADWLLNLAQIFGLPFRWANYDPTAAPETVDRISSMLQNMGSAGWAAFPSGTTLELRTEGMKAGNQTPQGDMLDRADKQCDLLVLGQTLTTDTGGMGAGGGSKALGQVHQDVRANVIDAAAKFVSGVLEQQLIPAILRLNFGNDDEAPTLTLAKDEQDDLTAKAAIIAQLKTAGAGAIIPLDWLGKTFGIPKPAEGEATLADAKPAAALNIRPGAAAPNIQHPTPNIEPFRQAQGPEPVEGHPTGDFVAASDGQIPWNPDLHPRKPNGQFTFVPGATANPAPKDGEAETFGPAAPEKLYGPPPPDAFGPPADLAPEKKRVTEQVPDSSDAPPLMPNPNDMPTVPDNVVVIALYNGTAPGNGVDKANGPLFKKAADYYGSYQTTVIDISKSDWPQQYAKVVSNYWYRRVWVYVFDHGGHLFQQCGNLQLRGDTDQGLKLWDFLTKAKNVKYFHLFGCNSGAKFFGDPVGSAYNSLTMKRGITVDMSEGMYFYILDQAYFPSTDGPIRRFPEK